jgi:hypothetical protein
LVTGAAVVGTGGAVVALSKTGTAAFLATADLALNIDALANGEPVSVAGALTTSAATSVTLYRGVAVSHPGYANATQGLVNPIGGHSDPLLHSLNDTKSVFTSWTTDVYVALGFATSNGTEAGVLLTVTVPTTSTFSVPANIQAVMNEAEVLLKGTVSGATVNPVR